MKNLLLLLPFLAIGAVSAQTMITVSDGSCFAPPFQFQACGTFNAKNQYCADNTNDLRIRWAGAQWEIILLTGGGNQIYYVSPNLNGVFPNEPPTDGWDLYSNPTPPPSSAPCANASSLSVFSLTLPVALIAFNVKTSESSNELRWTTSAEQNNNGYYIERKSEDGKDWQEIGFVSAKSHLKEPGTYLFVDNTPVKGLNYYRLRQVDIDGTQVFSPIVQVRTHQAMEVYLAPNPVQDVLNINLDTDVETDSKLRLFNSVGQFVQTMAWSGNQTSISLNALPSGTYLLEIESGGALLRRRILLRH